MTVGSSITLTLTTLAPAAVGDFTLVTELETGGKKLSIGNPSRFHLAGFLFSGRGNGHGLGMSQWGARGRAAAGQDYRAILSDYYRDTGIGRRDTSGTVRVSLTHGALDLSRAWPRLFGPLPMVAGPVTVEGVPLKAAAGEVLAFGANPTGQPVAFVASPGGTAKSAQVVISGTLTIRPAGASGIRTNLLQTMGADFRGGAEQRRYAGVLQIIPRGAAGLLPVNVLPIEDYLKGVVPAEMPAYWGAEALKAQAVAARTYALRKILLGGSGDFDLEGNEFDQAYGGLTEARAATDAAVDATAGEVLISGGHLIDALYTSSDGGHSENSEYGFIHWNHGLRPAASLPYLRGIADPLDHAPSWQVGPLSPSDAATILRDEGEDLGDRLNGIDILQTGPSGRILGARLRGSGSSDEVSGPYLRFLFGLPDTLVTIVGGP
jgi:SpoIID/LytB domain protein